MAEVRRTRVLIVNASGLTNVGDDAIGAAVLNDLRSALPNANFIVTSGNRHAGGADHTTIPFDDESIANAIDGADLVVIGGGGFFFDYDAALSIEAYQRGDFFHFYPYVRAAERASARSIPVCLYAVGVGPIVTPTGRALIGRALAAASAVTVRDELSARELRRLGLAAAVDVTADPAVRLPPADGVWDDRPEGTVVAFVARPWLRVQPSGTTPSGRAFFARYVDWLAESADAVIRRLDATPVFVASQTWNDDDRRVGMRIIERMRHANRARLHPGVVDYKELQLVLQSADAVVSTRLHPLILSAIGGVPAVGIAASPKVTSFLSAVGLAELAVSPWLANTGQLVDRIARVLETRGVLREHLATGLALQARAAARNGAVAAALVENST